MVDGMGNIDEENKVANWSRYYAKLFQVYKFPCKLNQRKILKVLWRHNTVRNLDFLKLGGTRFLHNQLQIILIKKGTLQLTIINMVWI